MLVKGAPDGKAGHCLYIYLECNFATKYYVSMKPIGTVQAQVRIDPDLRVEDWYLTNMDFVQKMNKLMK